MDHLVVTVGMRSPWKGDLYAAYGVNCHLRFVTGSLDQQLEIDS